MLVLGIAAYLFCSLITINSQPNTSLDKKSFEGRDELLNKDRL